MVYNQPPGSTQLSILQEQMSRVLACLAASLAGPDHRCRVALAFNTVWSDTAGDSIQFWDGSITVRSYRQLTCHCTVHRLEEWRCCLALFRPFFSLRHLQTTTTTITSTATTTATIIVYCCAQAGGVAWFCDVYSPVWDQQHVGCGHLAQSAALPDGPRRHEQRLRRVLPCTQLQGTHCQEDHWPDCSHPVCILLVIGIPGFIFQ